MKIYYPAIIKHNSKENSFNVEFPDLPGCLTFGNTLEEAIEFAKEALTGYLESIDSRKLHIPEPTNIKGKGVHWISPDKNVSFAIWLKKNREKLGLTQKQIAKKLKITYQTYQKFEDPHKSNPTLKTIIRLEKVFEEDLLLV